MKLFSRIRDKLSQFSLLFWVAFGVGLLYITWASNLPHGYFDTVDEGGKVLYIQNTLRTGNPAAPFIYPGRAFDPQGDFFPTWWSLQRGTEFYTWWQPGFPLISLPFFVLFGWLGLYVLPVIGGSTITYLSGILLSEIIPAPKSLIILCALSVGLATPVMYYSSNFHEHTLATAFVLASIIAALRSYQKNQAGVAFISGILGSLAVFFRTETVAIIFGVGLVLFVANWKLGLRFGTGIILASIPWMVINTFITGYPINHHANTIMNQSGPAYVTSLGWKMIPTLLFGQGGVGALPPPRKIIIFATIFTVIGFGLLPLKPTRVFASLAFLAVGLSSTWLLFSPVGYRTIHGLIFIAPQVLFSVMLIPRWEFWRKSLYPWMLVVGGTTFIIIYYLRAWSAAGGLQWGPRYMISYYPLLIVTALTALYYYWNDSKSLARYILPISFLVCTLIGFGFAVRGWYTNYTMLSLYKESEPTLRELSSAPIVSNYCDPPLHIPALYWEQVFFSTSRAGEEAWDNSVKKMDLTHYYRLDYWDACSADPFTEIIRQREKNPTGITYTEIK